MSSDHDTDRDFILDGSWPQYQKLVLAELERLSNAIKAVDDSTISKDDLREKFSDVKASIEKLTVSSQTNRNDITALKVKAGIWGAFGGVAAIGVAIGVGIISRII